MGLLQELILVCGALGVTTVVIVVMVRMSQSDRRNIDRLRAEWIAGGSIPEDEPTFMRGGGGSGGNFGT